MMIVAIIRIVVRIDVAFASVRSPHFVFVDEVDQVGVLLRLTNERMLEEIAGTRPIFWLLIQARFHEFLRKRERGEKNYTYIYLY